MNDAYLEALVAVKVLVVGSGAREHALAQKLKHSRVISEVFVWPGNAVTREQFTPLGNDYLMDWRKILPMAKSRGIEVLVIGPETFLAEGIADEAERVGLRVFGPNSACAQLESSKAFAKEFMAEAKIPTAAYVVVKSQQECQVQSHKMLAERGGVVIKASGLAAGKGVFVCTNAMQINEAIAMLYRSMASAAKSVVLEEILVGREVSFFCMLSPSQIHNLGFAVDYKRLNDGDLGPNTGGMGCYTPVPWLPHDATQIVEQRILQPMRQHLAKRQLPYVGWLYVGLMWGAEGPSVVEFNVRLGDPEAQVISVVDPADWGELILGFLEKSSDKKFAGVVPSKGKSAVAVVMASAGYPYGEGEVAPQKISREALNHSDDGFLFASSLSLNSETAQFVSGTGRVLSVVGVGETVALARKKSYERVKVLAEQFTSARYRYDIAKDI